MNDLSLMHKKLNFELVLVEKPYFYTDGKIIRSAPFANSEKMLLKEVVGDDLKNIIVALNKQHPEKETAIIYIGRDQAVVMPKDGKVSIQCLLM